MNPRIRRLVVVPAAVAVATLTGCFGGSTDIDWSDPGVAYDRVSIVDDGVAVAQTADYSVLESSGCSQIVLAQLPLPCIDVEDEPGSASTGAWRVDGTRFVNITAGGDIDRFVVWSSVSPVGRTIEPIEAAGDAVLVWAMEPGEEPWGVQVIGSDGTLASVVSWVGLPGE